MKEFKVRVVQLANGVYQVQRGQVEYEDRPCGGSSVKEWDVLAEFFERQKAIDDYNEEKMKNLKNVVEVIEEFSFKVG